jgi:hypothetical protein
MVAQVLPYSPMALLVLCKVCKAKALLLIPEKIKCSYFPARARVGFILAHLVSPIDIRV